MTRDDMINRLQKAGYRVFAELTPDAELVVYGDGRWINDHAEIVELLTTGINFDAITPEPV